MPKRKSVPNIDIAVYQNQNNLVEIKIHSIPNENHLQFLTFIGC